MDKEILDAEMMQAIVESFQGKSLLDILKMVKKPMNFKATFEGTPLDITVKFVEGAILARVKIGESQNDLH